MEESDVASSALLCSAQLCCRPPHSPVNGNIIGPSNLFQRQDQQRFLRQRSAAPWNRKQGGHVAGLPKITGQPTQCSGQPAPSPRVVSTTSEKRRVDPFHLAGDKPAGPRRGSVPT